MLYIISQNFERAVKVYTF